MLLLGLAAYKPVAYKKSVVATFMEDNKCEWL